MTPALLMSMSTGRPSASTRSAKSATASSEARSSRRTERDAAGTVARMRAAAASPLPTVRTGMRTSAPARASRAAISTPTPSLAPVTIASFPVRSGTGMSMVFGMVWLLSLRFGDSMLDRARSGIQDPSTRGPPIPGYGSRDAGIEGVGRPATVAP